MNKEQVRLLYQAIAKAWLYKKSRDRFLSDPKSFLQKAGLKLAGITLVSVTLIQSGLPQIAVKNKILEISFPPAPTELIELSEFNIMPDIGASEIPTLCFCIKVSSC